LAERALRAALTGIGKKIVVAAINLGGGGDFLIIRGGQ
jgi:hypothetical protein